MVFLKIGLKPCLLSNILKIGAGYAGSLIASAMAILLAARCVTNTFEDNHCLSNGALDVPFVFFKVFFCTAQPDLIISG